LAQEENASDMVGGAAAAEERSDLNSILLDLEQTHTINECLQLGGLTLSELKRVNAIQFSRPKQAGFRVLKNSAIPAILVETAYITNPNEERMLQRKSFQKELSRAISVAIRRFIPLQASREDEGRPAGGKGVSERRNDRAFPPKG
jgi:N-acetylmuramoyl-L-alanine amidase